MKKLLFLLIALLSVSIFAGTMSCSPTKPAESGSANAVPREAALAFAGAYAAFAALDATEAERLAAITKTGDPEKAKAAQPLAHKRNEQLHRLRDALELSRKWLAGEAGEREGRDALRSAAMLLQLVVTELREQGLAVPDEVNVGLKAAALLL